MILKYWPYMKYMCTLLTFLFSKNFLYHELLTINFSLNFEDVINFISLQYFISQMCPCQQKAWPEAVGVVRGIRGRHFVHLWDRLFSWWASTSEGILSFFNHQPLVIQDMQSIMSVLRVFWACLFYSLRSCCDHIMKFTVYSLAVRLLLY